MKLSKLKQLSEVEDEPIPSDIPSDDEMNHTNKILKANDEFVKTIREYKNRHHIFKRINTGRDEIHLMAALGFEPVTITSKNVDTDKVWGYIEFEVDVMLNMDPKPIIPTNCLQVALSTFFDEIVEMNPNLLDENIIPNEVLSKYYCRVRHFKCFPFNTAMDMRNYMDTHIYNLIVNSSYEFGELLKGRKHLLSLYELEPKDLPTFDDDYTQKIEKLLTKGQNVLRALSKGTWRGHHYELQLQGHQYRRHADLIILLDRWNYSKETKKINDDFELSANTGFEYIDGYKLGPEYNGPLTPDEISEFRKYLKKRFEHFGINYN